MKHAIYLSVHSFTRFLIKVLQLGFRHSHHGNFSMILSHLVFFSFGPVTIVKSVVGNEDHKHGVGAIFDSV